MLIENESSHVLSRANERTNAGEVDGGIFKVGHVQ